MTMDAIGALFVLLFFALTMTWLLLSHGFVKYEVQRIELPEVARKIMLAMLLLTNSVMFGVGVYLASYSNRRFLSVALLMVGGMALASSRAGVHLLADKRIFGRPVNQLITSAGVAATTLGFAAFGMQFIR